MTNDIKDVILTPKWYQLISYTTLDKRNIEKHRKIERRTSSFHQAIWKLDDWWIAGNWRGSRGHSKAGEADARVVCARPPFAKCRSAVIYLSTIDAPPEVNGRIVTISSWITVRMGRPRTYEATTRESTPCEARLGSRHDIRPSATALHNDSDASQVVDTYKNDFTRIYSLNYTTN